MDILYYFTPQRATNMADLRFTHSLIFVFTSKLTRNLLATDLLENTDFSQLLVKYPSSNFKL